jgi:hypothetical protein
LILGVIIFSSVFIKKSNKTSFLKKKTKPTGFGSDISEQIWLDFFSIWLSFFRFGSVSGLAQFFPIWVRFGFFSFRLIKPKANRTDRFFKNFNRFNQFFFTVWFFQLFCFWFS